jgi:hypothetical protein
MTETCSVARRRRWGVTVHWSVEPLDWAAKLRLAQ